MKTFARSLVDSQHNLFDLRIADFTEICALREVTPDETIDLFIAPALPRGMRICEVDRHSFVLGNLFMTGVFRAIIQGQGLTQGLWHPVKQRMRDRRKGGGLFVPGPSCNEKARGALNMGDQATTVLATHHHVTFPITHTAALIHDRRPLGDIHPVGNSTVCGKAIMMAPSVRSAPPQLAIQVPAMRRISIHPLVDRLCTDAHLRCVRIVQTQTRADDLRGPPVPVPTAPPNAVDDGSADADGAVCSNDTPPCAALGWPDNNPNARYDAIHGKLCLHCGPESWQWQ